jgi:regulator of RNase E activity RraB
VSDELLENFLPELPRDADADAMRRLVRDGSDLGEPMSVDFFVAVPDEASGEKVAEAARREGYRVTVARDGDADAWTCYCATEMLVTHEAVVAAQRRLAEISRPLGGRSDGWGTFGNA